MGNTPRLRDCIRSHPQHYFSLIFSRLISPPTFILEDLTNFIKEQTAQFNVAVEFTMEFTMDVTITFTLHSSLFHSVHTYLWGSASKTNNTKSTPQINRLTLRRFDSDWTVQTSYVHVYFSALVSIQTNTQFVRSGQAIHEPLKANLHNLICTQYTLSTLPCLKSCLMSLSWAVNCMEAGSWEHANPS